MLLSNLTVEECWRFKSWWALVQTDVDIENWCGAGFQVKV